MKRFARGPRSNPARGASPGKPSAPSCRLVAARARTDTDELGLAEAGSWEPAESQAGMEEKTCPAMRSRRWHQRLPQGAELCVPGHSKLFEQNMVWETSQAGMVPSGLPPDTHIPSVKGGVMASESQGLSQLYSGTGWEHSMNCWELCPHKSPGDLASRHLPRSLDRTLHAVICPSLSLCVAL